MGISPGLAVAVNALGYAVSGGLVAAIRTDLGGRTPPERTVRGEMLDGIRLVWRQPFLRAATLWSAVLNFATSAAFFGMLPLLALRGTSPVVVGAMSAVVAAGGLCGTLVAPRLASGPHRHRAVVAASATIAGLVGVAAAVPSSAVVVAALSLLAAAAPRPGHRADRRGLPGHRRRGHRPGPGDDDDGGIRPLPLQHFVTVGTLLDHLGAGPAYGVLAVLLAACVPLSLAAPVRHQLRTPTGADPEPALVR